VISAAISTMPLTGEPTAIRASALVTSSAAIGWVARTIEYGIEELLISSSCAVPTTDSAT
jgi:hypothetical protein